MKNFLKKRCTNKCDKITCDESSRGKLNQRISQSLDQLPTLGDTETIAKIQVSTNSSVTKNVKNISRCKIKDNINKDASESRRDSSQRTYVGNPTLVVTANAPQVQAYIHAKSDNLQVSTDLNLLQNRLTDIITQLGAENERKGILLDQLATLEEMNDRLRESQKTLSSKLEPLDTLAESFKEKEEALSKAMQSLERGIACVK